MITLPEFLLARYAELAAAAERLAENQRSWSWVPDKEHPTYSGEVPEIYLTACNSVTPFMVQFEAGEHIALNDPAYVLADIAAKRRIVEDLIEYDPAPHVVAPGGRWPRALCLLALPFAGHPDWREEWRP